MRPFGADMSRTVPISCGPWAAIALIACLTTPVAVAQGTACLEAARDLPTHSAWLTPDTEAVLCEGAEESAAPVRCLQTVMGGTVDWGGGTQWAPVNAVNLCRGTADAPATVACFEGRVGAGAGWRDAIAACQPSTGRDAEGPITTRDEIVVAVPLPVPFSGSAERVDASQSTVIHRAAVSPSRPLRGEGALSRFRVGFTNGDHKLRHLQILQTDGRAAVAFADQDANDPFAFDASWFVGPCFLPAEISATGAGEFDLPLPHPAPPPEPTPPEADDPPPAPPRAWSSQLGRMITLLEQDNGLQNALQEADVCSEGLRKLSPETWTHRCLRGPEIPAACPASGYTPVLAGFSFQRSDGTDANVRTVGVRLDADAGTARATLIDDQGADFRGLEAAALAGFALGGPPFGAHGAVHFAAGDAVGRLIAAEIDSDLRPFAATIQVVWVPEALVVAAKSVSGSGREIESGARPRAGAKVGLQGFLFHFGNSDHHLLEVGVDLLDPEEQVRFQDNNRDDPMQWFVDFVELR